MNSVKELYQLEVQRGLFCLAALARFPQHCAFAVFVSGVEMVSFAMTQRYLCSVPTPEPIAITMIFGLALSTLLTLGVVPILYGRFFRVNFATIRA